MAKSNLIKDKIISQVVLILEEKKKKCGTEILYFDEDISSKSFNSHLKITSASLFANGSSGFGSILWDEIDGQALLEMRRKLLKNEFHYFRRAMINDKYERLKLRLKPQ